MSKQKNKEILCVEILEAKENKMFTEEQSGINVEGIGQQKKNERL